MRGDPTAITGEGGRLSPGGGCRVGAILSEPPERALRRWFIRFLGWLAPLSVPRSLPSAAPCGRWTVARERGLPFFSAEAEQVGCGFSSIASVASGEAGLLRRLKDAGSN